MADLTIYSTTWCGYCRRLRRSSTSPASAMSRSTSRTIRPSADFVGSVNGGNHVVPTVKYADGSTATNPSLVQVKQALGR